MRKYAAFGLLVAIASVAPAKAATVADCAAMGRLARSIMEKRQEGVDMSAMMSALETTSDKGFIPVAKAIVIDAYAIPRWNGAEIKRRSIMDFSNDIQVKCYQSNPQ
ncbi:hypothetical protein EOB59_28890 [Mesorhizobium sp. M7A.F.Ca.MR.176.00.0.0]|uniref:hypothetical protein n=1 Tax=Mesorhizobium sp. M7A.F.Ca.MR.176.00.0.0 TaxID=2496776 RepID=UPI000FD5D2D7|nr:hypothetical protein [Mesorhizobium sp. M7A.F.Ca.MR.176.00.0.0]RUU86450.1 hypothetical protein EOB59_28890 [Mesorhizobium sp. M7A.F.Ca.MR.176.00.0.0]